MVSNISRTALTFSSPSGSVLRFQLVMRSAVAIESKATGAGWRSSAWPVGICDKACVDEFPDEFTAVVRRFHAAGLEDGAVVDRRRGGEMGQGGRDRPA